MSVESTKYKWSITNVVLNDQNMYEYVQLSKPRKPILFSVIEWPSSSFSINSKFEAIEQIKKQPYY